MELALVAPAAGLRTGPVEDAVKDNVHIAGLKDRAEERLARNNVPASAGGVPDEAPHVTLFRSSDARKRGRSYLGMTYSEPCFC